MRTLAGLSTGELGKAFLAVEPTMTQRLVRAKRKIVEAGIPYRVAPAIHLARTLVRVMPRSRWDHALIAGGVATLDEALAMRRSGPYQVQAAIAACHNTVYAELARLAPSPVVDLNRAVATAMAEGISAGLALVDELAEAGRPDGYYLLPATRADLLHRKRPPHRGSRGLRGSAGTGADRRRASLPEGTSS
ncbi:hypothetical protein [Prauserella flavalba]|uniref:hypothetical protein n=1 Tax=Prauserella flavalba TaxID=1477506 RepID=UPI001FE2E140|nr:hypothetical protein [Prauserella flavalba]